MSDPCEKMESPALPRGFLRSSGPESVYLRPVNVCGGSRYEILIRTAGATLSVKDLTVEDVLCWAREEGEPLVRRVTALLDRIAAPCSPFAGVSLDGPVVMGIVNVTPDSFSDGGDFFDPERAVAQGRALAAEGAEILDVGGESTRPGAAPVAPEEEIARVVPVIRALAAEGYRISIDTRRAEVMEAALAAGAAIINDVTALTGDPRSLGVAAESGVPVILMHMLGEPGTMQKNPRYDDPVLDIFDYLAERIAACEAAGIERSRIAVDPGIGFGKTIEHNTRILSRLGVFHGLGCPILLGASRKTFIARLSAEEEPKDRVPGSLVAVLSGVTQGVQIVRVHDVAATRQALAVWQAIDEAGRR